MVLAALRRSHNILHPSPGAMLTRLDHPGCRPSRLRLVGLELGYIGAREVASDLVDFVMSPSG
jgi:hypothetical protein